MVLSVSPVFLWFPGVAQNDVFFFFLDKSYDSLTADVFRLSKIKSKDRYKKLYDMHNGLFIDLGVISRTIIAVIR